MQSVWNVPIPDSPLGHLTNGEISFLAKVDKSIYMYFYHNEVDNDNVRQRSHDVVDDDGDDDKDDKDCDDDESDNES